MCGNHHYESRDNKVYMLKLLMEMLQIFGISPCHDLGLSWRCYRWFVFNVSIGIPAVAKDNCVARRDPDVE